MSIDGLGLILETAYHCKITEQAYGRLLEFRLYEDSDWQQIEIEAWVWAILEKRYKRFIEQWEMTE